MILVQIKNKQSEQITNEAKFESMQEVTQWVTSCEADKAFGETSKEEIKQVVLVEVSPAVEEVFDPETGEILVHAQEAILEEQEVVIQEACEAAYDILITEDYVDQEEANSLALKYLAETDYLVIRALEDPSKPVPQEIAEARQAARDRVIR